MITQSQWFGLVRKGQGSRLNLNRIVDEMQLFLVNLQTVDLKGLRSKSTA